MDVEVLEEHEDDPVVEELTSTNSLSEDEQIDLVALAWLGRDDYSATDWATVREEAARAHNQRTAEYLLGMPLLGDFVEACLSMLGYSAYPIFVKSFAHNLKGAAHARPQTDAPVRLSQTGA